MGYVERIPFFYFFFPLYSIDNILDRLVGLFGGKLWKAADFVMESESNLLHEHVKKAAPLFLTAVGVLLVLQAQFWSALLW